MNDNRRRGRVVVTDWGTSTLSFRSNVTGDGPGVPGLVTPRVSPSELFVNDLTLDLPTYVS